MSEATKSIGLAKRRITEVSKGIFLSFAHKLCYIESNMDILADISPLCKRHRRFLMLIFDLDGTLLDSNGVWIQVDAAFLARRGLSPTREYTDFVSHSIFPVAAQFTRDYYRLEETPQQIMDQWMALAREAYELHAPLKPGAAEYLEHCLRQGEEMALFTASVPELGRLAVERLGLDRFLSTLIFAQELGMEKRSPAAFAAALKVLGKRPEECVMFDDSPKNCAAAQAAGLTAIGVRDDLFGVARADFQGKCQRYIENWWELM